MGHPRDRHFQSPERAAMPAPLLKAFGQHEPSNASPTIDPHSHELH